MSVHGTRLLESTKGAGETVGNCPTVPEWSERRSRKSSPACERLAAWGSELRKPVDLADHAPRPCGRGTCLVLRPASGCCSAARFGAAGFAQWVDPRPPVIKRAYHRHSPNVRDLDLEEDSAQDRLRLGRQERLSSGSYSCWRCVRCVHLSSLVADVSEAGRVTDVLSRRPEPSCQDHAVTRGCLRSGRPVERAAQPAR